MEEQKDKKKDSLHSFISDGTPEEIRIRYSQLVEKANMAHFGELEKNIVVLDTETTGVSFTRDELTQIAAARYENGQIVNWFVTFVNPGKPIPEEVSRLTHITQEDVQDAPSPSEALKELVSFVGDAKIVAHNAAFDRAFTTKHPAGHSLSSNIWIDSLDLARIALPRLTSHRLLDLVRAFGGPLSTHRADADVEATCSVFRVLLAAVLSMPHFLVETIASFTGEWSTRIVFEIVANQVKSEDVSRETPSKARWVSALQKKNVSTKNANEREDADAIAADPHRTLQFPDPVDIEEGFSSHGVIGKIYSDYEPRQEQRAMAQAVCRAFTNSEHLVIEAGTGVGKSMAYLFSSAHVAQMNKIVVGVATKTNALLDQLVFHELPSLADALQKEDPQKPRLTYASLKGFSHYPCLRKIDQLVRRGTGMKKIGSKEVAEAPALAALISFIEQSDCDDIDGLKLDYRVLPRRSITTTSAECLRWKCPFFGDSCFVHGARRKAEYSDIVVTNHSLLFCDLVAEGGLLPPIRYWIIDEAHSIENEARRAFSHSLVADDIIRLSLRLHSEESSSPFVRLERKKATISAQERETLLYSLTNKARTLSAHYAEEAQTFSRHMKDLLYFDQSERGRGYESVEIWVNEVIRSSEKFSQLSSFGKAMAHSAEKLIKVSQDLVAYLEGMVGVEELQREIAGCALELKDQVQNVKTIFDDTSLTYAYSATISRNKDKVGEKLEALLIQIDEKMNETLFSQAHSVVFSSATLALGDSFSDFERTVGLNTSEQSKSISCRLASSYDFDHHMTVYVASDIPEPNSSAYLASLQKFLEQTHRAQAGSMLTLFTNRREMEKCFEEVFPRLKKDDLRVVCQKWGVSTKGLRDDFIADKHLSLFALKSFWEGFDAPGSTLRGVFIPKLPFSKPTDPLSCERAERDPQAWKHYVLPAAVIEVKQAVGRLIRKAEDRGVVVFADSRLVSKSYGKIFLDSLPTHTINIMTMADIVEDILRKST